MTNGDKKIHAELAKNTQELQKSTQELQGFVREQKKINQEQKEISRELQEMVREQREANERLDYKIEEDKRWNRKMFLEHEKWMRDHEVRLRGQYKDIRLLKERMK